MIREHGQPIWKGHYSMLTDKLSDSERAVWEAFPRAETVDFRAAAAPGPGAAAEAPAVRADVIAALLLGAREAEADRVPAMRLWGARITGQLDLAFAEVRHAILLRDCVFDEEPRLYGASTRLVNLSQSRLPGLQLSDAHVDGLLLLEGCHISGPVRLTGAHVDQNAVAEGHRLARRSGPDGGRLVSRAQSGVLGNIGRW